MDKFYIKDDKFYVENDVELIELALDELIDAINVLARKEAMMEIALELACETVNDKYAKPFGNNVDYTEYFKNEAKEKLKNEIPWHIINKAICHDG